LFSVDFSPLFSVAEKEFFSMPVVGTFSPMVLMAHPMTPTCSHTIDFRTATIEDLQVIDIPIRFAIGQTGVMHGLAGWVRFLFVNYA
jgi:histone-arginine methyltransferase CARM1